MVDGQAEKAREIYILLGHFNIENKKAQNEFKRLQADLLNVLPEEQMSAAMQHVNDEISPVQARAEMLAYIQAHEIPV